VILIPSRAVEAAVDTARTLDNGVGLYVGDVLLEAADCLGRIGQGRTDPGLEKDNPPLCVTVHPITNSIADVAEAGRGETNRDDNFHTSFPGTYGATVCNV
jgi:hypothetical protein